MIDLAALLADLRAEGDDLERLVAGLDDAGWGAPTPAAGWTVAHQVAHLAGIDHLAVLAATDADAFLVELAKAVADPDGYVDAGAAAGVAEPPRLMERWRASRLAVLDALAAVPPGAKLPWFGTYMSASSMATGRVMETWAHGQDVADALDTRREPTARLRHVAHLGVRTRDHAFGVHGLPPPAEEFRIELAGPGGRADEVWTWGPPDAPQRVTGPALDFCLLVTRRRHRSDLALAATGVDAGRWLDIAQAFAGPPGAGRAAGQFA